MAKISAMRSDPELVEGGRWVPWALGMELRLARWNNLRFQIGRAHV